MNEQEKLRKRLEHWKGVVERDEAAWQRERVKMDWREQLYKGTKRLLPVTAAEEKLSPEKLRCYHVRNVIAENLETMVDSHVPMPKIIPLRKSDEELARKLEHLLKFYVMRRHLRVTNDLAERISYTQGAVAYLVEWDNGRRTPDGIGDVQITLLHPKQLIPQDGVNTDIQDMDRCTVKLAVTRQAVLRRFGVRVEAKESDLGIRGQDGETATAEDLITLYLTYYRNDAGGIGLFAWCEDTVVADYEDYQARRLRRCRQCGALDYYTTEEAEADEDSERVVSGEKKNAVHRCPFCEGTAFVDETVDYEEVYMPQVLLSADGKEIELQDAEKWVDNQGRLIMKPRTRIKYYKPDLFPIVLQKNVSQFGALIGESDVDRMADQQNTIKRMDKKIIDRLIKAGTLISLPSSTSIRTSTEDSEVIRLDRTADVNMIRTFDLSGDVSSEMQMEARSYEEARQHSGVTDSMQGRRDPTATSARAKEFAANKSEGRMQSKRVMKAEAWAKIYEIVAKLMLAYAEDAQHIRVETANGDAEYEEFNRKDFLKTDAKGQMYYEDGFIFTCDDATLLSESREQMWRAIDEKFAAGTLGDPKSAATRVLYWGLLEEQGYPGAAGIKRKLQQQAEQEAQQAMAAQQRAGAPGPTPGIGGTTLPPV